MVGLICEMLTKTDGVYIDAQINLLRSLRLIGEVVKLLINFKTGHRFEPGHISVVQMRLLYSKFQTKVLSPYDISCWV